jgi:tRNA threonylcarbamoyladenosine biosynthesis protein TsaB
MKVLGFDTATRATSVALLDTDSGAVTERRDDPEPGHRPRHTTQLMSLIAQVLAAAGCNWDDLGLIAVGVGPGTFTGLRIGVATARALAQAREIPLAGVSTLHSLALCALPAAEDSSGVASEAVLAVLDARRREVFAGGWSVHEAARAGATPLLAPQALSPPALAKMAQELERHTLMVGDGAIEFRAVLERSGAWIPEDDSPLHRVTATGHCRLATGLAPQPPDAVRPEYLRLPDAELSLRASQNQ